MWLLHHWMVDWLIAGMGLFCACVFVMLVLNDEDFWLIVRPNRKYKFGRCDECGYDMTATLGVGRRRCPECGTRKGEHWRCEEDVAPWARMFDERGKRNNFKHTVNSPDLHPPVYPTERPKEEK